MVGPAHRNILSAADVMTPALAQGQSTSAPQASG
jgi:hypothetical protein